MSNLWRVRSALGRGMAPYYSRVGAFLGNHERRCHGVFIGVVFLALLGSGCIGTLPASLSSPTPPAAIPADLVTVSTATTTREKCPLSNETIHPEIALLSRASTGNWVTFTDKRLGVRFKYPPDMRVEQERQGSPEPSHFALRLISTKTDGCTVSYGIASQRYEPEEVGHRVGQQYMEDLRPQTGVERGLPYVVMFADWRYLGDKRFVTVSAYAERKCLTGDATTTALVALFRMFLTTIYVEGTF